MKINPFLLFALIAKVTQAQTFDSSRMTCLPTGGSAGGVATWCV